MKREVCGVCDCEIRDGICKCIADVNKFFCAETDSEGWVYICYTSLKRTPANAPLKEEDQLIKTGFKVDAKYKHKRFPVEEVFFDEGYTTWKIVFPFGSYFLCGDEASDLEVYVDGAAMARFGV